MVHPILLICRHIIPQELLDHQVDPLSLSISLGAEGSAHLELRPHSLPKGLPKFTCKLWVSVRDYVLWKTMMLENMCEEQSSRPWAVASSFVGMKCAILLNRSTTTMMASKPLDGGKFTMKSMDTFSHGPWGISKGCNKPACFLLSVRFCWQIKHVFTYSSASSFKLGH